MLRTFGIKSSLSEGCMAAIGQCKYYYSIRLTCRTEILSYHNCHLRHHQSCIKNEREECDERMLIVKVKNRKSQQDTRNIQMSTFE